MEGAGGQPNRANIPQAAQCQGCSSSPFKVGFEKRRLSLRSNNATTFTTQAACLSFRQPTGSVQKQSGKENELPFDQEIGEKKIVTFAKSENKKKKPPVIGVFADSEKRVLKRRLSGDYRDHLSSNKFYRGEIEPVNRPAKLGADFTQTANNRQTFSVYDDGGNEESENEIKALLSSTGSTKQRFGLGELDRRNKHDKDTGKDVDDSKEPGERWLRKVDRAGGDFYAAIKALEVKPPPNDTVDDLSAAGENAATSKSQFVKKGLQSKDSPVEKNRAFIGSIFANESSEAEFRIERVDRRDGMPPAMNNLRKFKSGSSIQHLKLSIRRGGEISPLKRRFIQFKRSTLNLRNGADVETELSSPSKSPQMGSMRAEEVKKLAKEPSNCNLESTLHPSEAEATDKTSFETLVDRKLNRGSLRQGEKSLLRHSSEPSLMRIGTIAANPPVSGDRHKLSPIGVIPEPQIGMISSQHPIVTLSPSSPIAKCGSAARFDTEVEKIESCEPDMILRKKWDAVVAEFKNKLKPHAQVEKHPIHAVASNQIVKLAPNRIPGLSLQLSLALRSKFPAKNETKVSKSATRANTQKGIEAQPDVETAIATKDKLENSVQYADIEECARTVFKHSQKLPNGRNRHFNATDYEEEAIKFEYARERRAHQISKSFLKGKTVLPEQRKIVVNFLIGVHAYLLTSSSTLYQAIKIFDAILDLKDVSMKELQLVALGASWIAIKNIETNIPSASVMISFAKDMYAVGGSKLLCKCEKKILKTLNFNLRFSDPFYMLSHYIEQGLASGILPGEPSIRKIYHCAHYIMHTALLDERYSGSSAQLLAAATAQTSVHLMLGASENRAKWFQWHNEKITGYPQKKIERFVAPLIVRILESAEKNSSTSAVYKKYRSSRYGNISDYLITKIKNQPEFPPSK